MSATLQRLSDFYRVRLKIDFAIQLQYRSALAIWLIGAVLEPLIYLTVWNAVANAQGGEVGGLTTGDFAAYFIVGLVVNQLTFTWVMWNFEAYIREGTLAANLLRPIHPIHMDVSDNVTYKALTLVVIVPTIIIMSIAFKPTWNMSAWSLAAFVPALFFAFVLRFVLEWTLALSAFWTTRTGSANQLYYTIFMFFSGRLAPLSLFPPALVVVANILPFRWTLAFPIELFLGQLTPQEALWGMGIQLGWIAAALILLRIVWRAAVRRFSAVGG